MTNQLTALVTVKGWRLYGCLKELERTCQSLSARGRTGGKGARAITKKVLNERCGLEDAGRELVCTLHSNDPDIAVLASAILESRSQTAGTLDATFGNTTFGIGGKVITDFGGAAQAFAAGV
jgi:hypothetical protein